MVLKINSSYYNCPFCSKNLESKYSKCYNIYCQGQKFNIGNLVVYRLNPDLGIGRIIKILEIPASKSLEEEDTYLIKKYKVLFRDNIVKVLHPIDLVHQVFKKNERIITKIGEGVINSNDFFLKEGTLSYEVLYPDGKLTQIQENAIYSKYETPIKKLISRNEINPTENFLIKYWANLFHSYYTSYQIKCITNSRLSLMPHQINIAHRLSEEYFPSMILADEVGLGKTIEAGIYIKEMLARGLAERVLIIVPATLVQQWKFEMENKFNIDFKIYDGKKIKELNRRGSPVIPELLHNPFYYDNVIICSLQFVRNPKYRELLSEILWDIVIFDEAHHLRRYLINAVTGNYRETLNFTLAKKLSQNCESLLLLTATPLQLHPFELYSLIDLIHPEAFDNYSDFEHFRKNMPFINLLVSNLTHLDNLNTFELKNMIKLLKELNYVDKKKNDDKILAQLKSLSFRNRIINKIEKDHTLSRFLIRNRKKNVISKDFLNRRIVKTIIVNPTQQELDIYNEIRLYLAKIFNASINKKDNIGLGFVITTLQKLLTSSKYAFMRSIERRLEQIKNFKEIKFETLEEEDPEYYLLELEDQYIDLGADELNQDQESDKEILDLFNQEKILKDFYDKLKRSPYDSKSDELINLLYQIHENNKDEKIIIFTQFVDTLFFIKNKLTGLGYYVETFYGGLNKKEKDEAVERFRTTKNFAILLSTEIGGEGRNFQFCRIMINFDLPWNPMKLEQRIGRLDRIGQESREIYIYNFFLEGTIETDIVFALNKRINLFEESIGVLEPIIGKIEKDIKNLIFSFPKEKQRKIREFSFNLEKQIQKAKEIEMQLDDLMIDKKSFQIDGLISSFAVCNDVKLSHTELFHLINYFFNLKDQRFGYIENIKENNEFITKISINSSLLHYPKLQLSREYYGTFSLDLARNKEEIDFFALGHPLIDTILDYCRSNLFQGTFTILNLKREFLPTNLEINIDTNGSLYLFVFIIKFQGYILENQISAIVIDENGFEINNMADFILNIENYNIIFDFNEFPRNKIYLNQKVFEELIRKSKNSVKSKTSLWKREIKALNDKIFNLERSKREKIYEHKRKALSIKLESLKQKLEKMINQRPTERQKQNINNLKDKKKKKKKLEKIEKLEEEIRFTDIEIRKIGEKLDDLAFEYEDLKNDMKKRNLGKFYTNLLALAIILIV
ncbi:MAG: DEAD/DEAH box helicase [Candidatus Hodarchaeota archaeon]